MLTSNFEYMYLSLHKETQVQDTWAAYINLLLKCKQTCEGTAKPTCITYIYEKAEYWAISLTFSNRCKELLNPFRCSTGQRGLTIIRAIQNITSATKERNQQVINKKNHEIETPTPILQVTNFNVIGDLNSEDIYVLNHGPSLSRKPIRSYS